MGGTVSVQDLFEIKYVSRKITVFLDAFVNRLFKLLTAIEFGKYTICNRPSMIAISPPVPEPPMRSKY